MSNKYTKPYQRVDLPFPGFLDDSTKKHVKEQFNKLRIKLRALLRKRGVSDEQWLTEACLRLYERIWQVTKDCDRDRIRFELNLIERDHLLNYLLEYTICYVKTLTEEQGVGKF